MCFCRCYYAQVHVLNLCCLLMCAFPLASTTFSTELSTLIYCPVIFCVGDYTPVNIEQVTTKKEDCLLAFTHKNLTMIFFSVYLA